MKRLFLPIICLCFLSCTKQESEVPAPQVPQPELAELTFTSAYPRTQDPVTSKTAWNGGAIEWTRTDRVRIACYNTVSGLFRDQREEGDGITAKLYSSNQANLDAEGIASFDLPSNISFSLPADDSPCRFYAIYPGELNGDDANFTRAPLVKKGAIASSQSLVADNLTSDILIGRSKKEYTASELPSAGAGSKTHIPLEWTRPVAFDVITLKAMNLEEGEVLRSVRISAEKGLALTGELDINLLTGEAAPKQGGAVFNHVEAVGELAPDASGNFTFWLTTLPFRTFTLEVVADTDRARYSRKINLSSALDFMVNCRNLLTINMSSAKRISFEDIPAQKASGCLEMPSVSVGAGQRFDMIGEGTERNYSFLYDTGRYASLWVAYPLAPDQFSGTDRDNNWSYYPSLEESLQVSVTTASYQTQYLDGEVQAGQYARGHQCPSASRLKNSTMNHETFYVINQTPQIQAGFNSGMWNTLEAAVRSATSNADTVYVCTGPCYVTVGGNESVKQLTAAKESVSPKTLDVPNYYFKVLLKVRRDSQQNITGAIAIGFWLENRRYDGSAYQYYACSIREIESLTGLDFFAGLPQSFQDIAETNTSWSSFMEFNTGN